MNQKLTSITLILCVLGSLMQFSLPLQWYIANYNHITTELCINRDNPDIDCNGMCQLRKKLNKTDDHQENKAQNKSGNHDLRLDQFLVVRSFNNVDTSFEQSCWLSIHQLKKSQWITEPASPPPRLV